MKTKLAFVIAILMVSTSSLPLQAHKWPVYAKNGMVVSTEKIASEIGVEVLSKGGNAVDAAVATGFALAVVHPAAGNIGGGGFMVIRMADGRSVTIDYRERAPKAAHSEMYLDEKGELVKGLNHNGYLAIGVPGTVAGLVLALEKYGTMPLKKVLKPAIRLADKGYRVSYGFHDDLSELAETFRKYPSSAKKFLHENEKPYEMGELFKQKNLAGTLKRISKKGHDGFYFGKTAELIAKDMAANGGLITLEDLAEYKAVVREPIETSYKGYTITGMPPPSSGGITVGLMLNMLEPYELGGLGHNSAAYIHLLAEVMKRGFSQRARYLGDPDFNPEMPVERLTSKDLADQLRETIDLAETSASSPTSFEWKYESSETTHFSVVDGMGNAVSNTYTIEAWYGTKIVAAGAGFLYNNEMGDFNPWPGHTDEKGLIGTVPNLIEPGKRMLSSMAPTIVSKDGKVVMVTGSPGGRAIINTVMQTILNVIDFEMNIFDAVDSPRFHHQWLPDAIRMEKGAASKDTQTILQEMGHKFTAGRTQGRAMAIYVDPATGLMSGAADPRSPNRGAVGY